MWRPVFIRMLTTPRRCHLLEVRFPSSCPASESSCCRLGLAFGDHSYSAAQFAPSTLTTVNLVEKHTPGGRLGLRGHKRAQPGATGGPPLPATRLPLLGRGQWGSAREVRR